MVTFNRLVRPATRTWILGFLSVALLVLCSSNLFAQQYLASISGTVTDAAGAVIPNATVTAENDDTHFKTTTTSNQVGAYTATFLTPGTYSISVSVKGFRPARKTDIVLHASDRGIVDVQLSIGSETQSVEVTADLQVLDAGSASLGQVLDKEEIVNLPNMGRNPYVEATLAAGTYSGNMVTGSGSQYNNPYSGTASQMQIGGVGNAHRLELNGMPNDAPERLSAVTYTNFVPSPEAVQEVSTQTMLVDAQYGHSDGAVINTIIRTGQNQLHGAAYYILQNTAMNSNTSQRKQTSATRGKPSVDKWQQPGFVLSGPIDLPKIYNGKDKSFFTVAFERVQTNTPNPYSSFMPTDAMRAGDFSSLCSAFDSTGLCTTGVQLYKPTSAVTGNVRTEYFANNNIASAINPVAAQIIKYFPKPNTTGGGTTYNYVSQDDTIKDKYWSFITRIDHKLTPSQTLTGLFFRSVRNQEYPVQGFGVSGNGVGGPGYSHFRNNTGASVEWMYSISPTLVLDSRIGFIYHPFSQTYHGDNFSLSTLGFGSTFASAVPRQTFPGISFSKDTNQYGAATSGGGTYSEATASAWTEVLTKVINRHTVKAGIEANDLRYNLMAPVSNIGTFGFTRGFTRKNISTEDGSGDPMASFLLGAINSDTVSWNIAPAFDQKYFGIFLHDDWRVSNKLSVNVGVRWDYESPMTERHNQMNAGFCFTCVNPLQSSVTGLTLNGGLKFVDGNNRMGYNKQLNNFQPRFGAAYTINNKTLIRGGLGLIYLPTFDHPGNAGFSATTGYVNSLDGATPANSFANPFPGGLVKPTGSTLGLSTFLGQGPSPEDVNHRQPRMFFGSLGVQYQLPMNTLVEVVYAANLTRNMPVSKSVNNLPQAAWAMGKADLDTKVANPMAGLIPSNANLNGSTIYKSFLMTPYPEFGGFTLYNRPLGSTSYNALQLTLRKRFSHGYSFQAHYTWSKQMNATSYLNGVDNWDQIFRRESSAPNRIWNIIGSYDIPTPYRSNYWSRMVLGGWSLHTVLRSHNGSLIGYPSASGQVDMIPGANLRGGGSNRSMTHQFNTCYIDTDGNTKQGGVTVSTCGQGDGSPAWKVRLAPTTAGGSYALTLASYNTIMPGIRQMVLPIADSSLFKKFVIREKINFELRGEFFNIANTPNYGTPTTSLNSGSAGTLSWSQGNDPRMGQVTARINF